MEKDIDLYAVELDVETLDGGAALDCLASATSASTASCPATSASSFTTASSYT